MWHVERAHFVADDGIRDLWLQHRSGQDKYAYFLLAAAASAVAFAIQKTEGHILDWSMAPVGLAVMCWGSSFYCGCKAVEWIQTSLYANYSLLQLGRGVHPDQPRHPHELEAAQSGVRQAIDSNTRAAAKYSKWQFRLLIIGALGFIGWHVLGLAMNSIAT
jgi:hypothetical protein